MNYFSPRLSCKSDFEVGQLIISTHTVLQCIQLVLGPHYARLSDALVGPFRRSSHARTAANMHECSQGSIESLAGSQNGSHVV